MIGTSTGELVMIRLFILLFRYMPILYIVILACSYLLQNEYVLAQRAQTVSLCLLFAEFLFYAFIYAPHEHKLRQAAIHPNSPSSPERKALFEKCIANTSHLEEYLRWWFLGARMEDIRQDNLREFYLWAFFDTDMQAQSPEAIDQDLWNELEKYISLTEQRLGHPIHKGKGPAKCLRLTFDDVPSAYRCLLWYFVVFLVDITTHVVMTWHGFRYYARSTQAAFVTFPPRPQELFANHRSPEPGLGYWFRPHTCPNKRPTVFWHGIGVGLWTYVWFLIELGTSISQGDVGLIVPEMLPISFRLTQPPPTKDELLRMIEGILNHHREWETFTLVSHSYGSAPTTHMLHSSALQHRIAAVVLIDPVTVLLHLPNVAYNFTRRPPKKANEWQLWYFASNDLGVAHSLGRHFFWRDNILWQEDLFLDQESPAIRWTGSGRRKVAVSLSGRDLIVDTASVAKYLTSQPRVFMSEWPIDHASEHREDPADEINVMLFPDLDHAQVFDRMYARGRLVKLVHSYS